jgi:steroid delta-isomerase-like uncharacterized protein
MSTEQNKALIRRQAKFLAARDLDAVIAEISPDIVDHELPPGMPAGVEGFRQFFTMVFAAFPDLASELEEILAEGDKVATRITLRGTHSGVFLGIPATGKKATWSIMDMYRIADGKVAEHWGLGDQLGLMQQLGVVPPPRAGP